MLVEVVYAALVGDCRTPRMWNLSPVLIGKRKLEISAGRLRGFANSGPATLSPFPPGSHHKVEHVIYNVDARTLSGRQRNIMVVEAL